MLPVLDDFDWKEAFGYAGEPGAYGSPNVSSVTFGAKADPAPFTREDVRVVFGMDEGERDAKSWMIYGMLNDSRYFFIEAGCEYTGWDCQASGSAIVSMNFTDLVQYGMTDEARERLKVGSGVGIVSQN